MRYFAYGSNLRSAQMLKRCPSARKLANATLRGWRLGFTGWSASWQGSVATIMRDGSTEVPGVVYDIADPRDVRVLDAYEGCPAVYSCRRILVTLDDGRRVKAWTYIKVDPRPGTPSNDYAMAIAGGLREHTLPLNHLAQALLAAGFSEVSIRKQPVAPIRPPVFRAHVDEVRRPTPVRMYSPNETRPRFDQNTQETLW